MDFGHFKNVHFSIIEKSYEIKKNRKMDCDHNGLNYKIWINICDDKNIFIILMGRVNLVRNRTEKP